jgi:hypothetical protein
MWAKVDEHIIAQVFTNRRVFIPPTMTRRAHAFPRGRRSIEQMPGDIRVVEFTSRVFKADVSDWFAASSDNTPCLLALCESTAPWLPGSEGHVITNFTTDEIEDANGKKKKVQTRIDLAKILRSILFACNGWPKRLGNQLFIDHSGEIFMLDTDNDVFAFLPCARRNQSGLSARTLKTATTYSVRRLFRARAPGALPLMRSPSPNGPEPQRVYNTRHIPKAGTRTAHSLNAFLPTSRSTGIATRRLLCGLALARSGAALPASARSS